MSGGKKIGAILFGIAALVVIGTTIYRLLAGKEVGFNEVMTISILLMGFFSAITWGTKGSDDGIMQEEELGQRITEKSSKISYFILIAFILVAVSADKFVNGTSNIFLIIVLGLAMIILPLVEYVVARKYQ